MPCQVTQIFQLQLLVIQYTIKMLYIGFMQVLTIVVEISVFKFFKILKFSYCRAVPARARVHTHTHIYIYIYIYIHVDASVVYIPPPHRVIS